MAVILKATRPFYIGLVLGALFLAGCGIKKEPDNKNTTKSAQHKQNKAMSSQKAAQLTEPPTKPEGEYELVGYYVALLTDKDNCRISYRAISPNSVSQYLTLALSPPCYWLRGKFPTNTADRNLTDGIPIINSGGIMAIKYPSAQNTTVAIVIGRARGKPDDPELRGYYKGQPCGSHMQGLLLSENPVRLSEPEFNVGIRCSEIGTDEKEFWLFAHDDLKKSAPRSKR